MPSSPPPFAAFEWQIAWRYLRARRKEGGISVIAWYALVGVMLGVATLIVVQAVMIGFREEFTDRILGANAHVTVYYATEADANGTPSRLIPDYDELAARLAAVPGVTHAAPLVRGQVMIAANGRASGVEVIGTRAEDLATVPLVAHPEAAAGDLGRFGEGIAIGTGVARDLGVGVGDTVTLIAPEGMDTPFGTQPRVSDYEVVYVFGVGRFDIDKTRVYMPLAEAQSFFDREGAADEIEVMVERPDRVEEIEPALAAAAGPRALLWTWRDASGAFLSALDTERRVMFIILSLVVVIAALNIISGLVMLVKNKGRDIGILQDHGADARVGDAGLLPLRVADRGGGDGARGRPRLPLRLLHPRHPGGGGVGDRRVALEPRDPLPDRDPGAAAPRRRAGGDGDGAGAVVPHHALPGAERGAAEPGRGAAL